MTETSIFTPWKASEDRSSEAWCIFLAIGLVAATLLNLGITYGIRAAEAGHFAQGELTSDDKLDAIYPAAGAVSMILLAALVRAHRRIDQLANDLRAAGIPTTESNKPVEYGTKLRAPNIEG